MYGCEEETNGSKAVSLLLRLSTLVLALTSAVLMATAPDCTVVQPNATALTTTYNHLPPFLFFVGFNIAAAILEAAAIYLQLSAGDEEEELGGKLPGILLVVIDVAVQALVYSSAGAVCTAAYAYRGLLGGACAAFGEQVHRVVLLSLAASFSVGLAAVAKDVPLPFSVWPNSAD